MLKIMKSDKARRGETLQGKARQDETKRHPDKQVSAGFVKYCTCDEPQPILSILHWDL